MGGCFGNHPVDRWMENQLFWYLDECADFEEYCTNVIEHVDDALWENYTWWFEYSHASDHILDVCAFMKLQYKQAAAVLEYWFRRLDNGRTNLRYYNKLKKEYVEIKESKLW